MKHWLTLVICLAAGCVFATDADVAAIRDTVDDMAADISDLRLDNEAFAGMWQNAFGSAGFGTEDLRRLELYGRVLLESLGVGYGSVVNGGSHDNPRYLARIARLADTMQATNDVWLKVFLTGRTDGDNDTRPFFQHAGTYMGSDTAENQSLQYFLGTTLGQFWEMLPRPGSPNASWGGATTWDAAFVAGGEGAPIRDNLLGRNYQMFTYWLAEAERRQIAALSNIVDKLSGSLDGDNSIEEPEHTSDEAGSIARGAIDVPDRPGWWTSSTLAPPSWSVSGSAGDAVIYSFPGATRTRSGSTGVLAIRFQSDGWGAKLRAALQFCVVVSTAACMVAIIRSEINYWSTLGGSAS